MDDYRHVAGMMISEERFRNTNQGSTLVTGEVSALLTGLCLLPCSVLRPCQVIGVMREFYSQGSSFDMLKQTRLLLLAAGSCRRFTSWKEEAIPPGRGRDRGRVGGKEKER